MIKIILVLPDGLCVCSAVLPNELEIFRLRLIVLVVEDA